MSPSAAFISKERIAWPNYHDPEGLLGKTFERNAIPLGILIDAQGKIIFYKSAYEIGDLKRAIAKLGPEFSSMAQPVLLPSRPKSPSGTRLRDSLLLLQLFEDHRTEL